MNLRFSPVMAWGNWADSRYLTQLPNAAMVLPTDGRPPIVVDGRGRTNDWVPEVRLASGSQRGSWAQALVQALLDAGMERARIGVCGLKGGKVTHVRAPDGVVNYTTLAEVIRQLPNATFEDATDVVGFARYLKGDEEVECLRRAAFMAEEGIDAMVEAARPGADQAVVYTRAMARMMELGSEHYLLAFYAAPLGTEAQRMTDPPIGRRLRLGDYITNETSAAWGGQVSQEDQPILLGPIPDEWKPLIELQREVFEAGLAFMKPGTAFSDMIDFVNGFGLKRGLKTLILMHGRGIGDDNGPLLTPRSTGEDIRDVRIERGNVWVFKPYAMTPDERLSFVWGGDVVVTEKGGERLFKRSHGMVSVT
jgi:Xaa-Pro aminopeptidase